jgi:hypothetical protein
MHNIGDYMNLILGFSNLKKNRRKSIKINCNPNHERKIVGDKT